MSTSIDRRIRYSLLGLTLGLSVVFSGLALLLVYITEDQLFANQLYSERTELKTLSATELKHWQPAGRHMRLYRQLDQLPEYLRAEVGQIDGIYEYFDDEGAFFIMPVTLPQIGGQRFFLVYDVSSVLAVRANRSAFLSIVGFGVILVMLIAVAVALYLARATLQPVKRLTDQLKQPSGDELPSDFAKDFSDDEIGTLAKALESALIQVRQSVKREFEFNRGVSHELRTPIQIAKNALELVDISEASNEPTLQRPLQRLSRAVDQMQTLTEAFLWLASERTWPDTSVSASESLERLIEEQQHLLQGKPVRIETQVESGIRYPMPGAVLNVVLGNLLRNAIQHTEQGRILCVLNAREILVEDSGGSIGYTSASEKGFGIGLIIVDRICERFGWKFKLLRLEEGGTRASIDFSG